MASHKFRCPDGHEFEAGRVFRAHCPECGKNAQRLYQPGEEKPDGEADTQVKEPTEATDGKPEDDPPIEDKKEKDGETKSTHSPRRVKVTRGQKTEKEDDSKAKDKPSKTPAKRVKIRKGAAPLIKKKIVTTRDRKMRKEEKEKRSTHWTTMGKIAGFYR